MNSRRTRLLVAGIVAIALVVGVPAVAGAVKSSATWAPWLSMREIAENPPLIILGSSKEWSYPDIDGDYVVFNERLVDGDGTGPGSDPGDWNVYLYKISTGAKTAVAAGAGDQMRPRISGDWVVYEDAAAGNNDVKAYRISTGATTVVASGAGSQDVPDVSGTKVVYATDTPSDQVRMFSLSTSADTLVQDGADSPAISGDRIVYTLADEIVIKDLTNGAVTQVTDDAEYQYSPRIDGDKVVFLKSVGFLDYDVYAYDISTAVLTAVATTGQSYGCDVSGTRAVWETYDGGAPFLQAYDFVRGKTVTLAEDDPTHLTQPMVSGNRVVFVSASTSFFEASGKIRLGTLSAPALTLSVQSTDNYAAAPRLTGKLTENGNDLGAKSLDILRSTDGGHTWAVLGTTTTTSSGSYSYLAPAAYRKAWYRVRFNGQTEGFISTYLSRFSALSDVKSMTPRAYVGTPTGYPSTGKKTKYYTVYGTLKPRQTAASAASKIVTIKCYRLQSGKYVLRRTYNAKVFDYSTYSRYSASVKLPYSGKWRIRAYFKGTSTNAAKYSSYRYVKAY